MIYQFNDPARSSDLEAEQGSTVYCNSASLMQSASGTPADRRKNSSYSASSRGVVTAEDYRRSDPVDREVIGNRGSRLSSSAGHHSQYNNRNGRSRRHYENSDTSSSKSTTYGSTCTDSSCSGSETSSSSGEPNLPYPGFPEVALRYLRQDTKPRNWCLLLITNPWFERISILVILFNCITLGMYQPCVDDECVTNRCKILQVSLLSLLFVIVVVV